MFVPILSASGAATASVSGTVVSGLTETQVVSGGETLIIILINDTWLAAGTGPVGTIANTQAIIDGITAAESEATGWNAEVRDKEVVGSVVRDSDTQITITWTAAAAYDVTASETITVTVPAQALTGGVEIVASPTFGVTADVAVTTSTIKGGVGKRHRKIRKLPDGRLTFADDAEIRKLLNFYKVSQEELEEAEVPIKVPSRKKARKLRSIAMPAPEIIFEMEEEADLQFVLKEIARMF